MTVIDSYLLRLFTRWVLVGFVCLFGLYVVIDVFSNLDEFITYGKTEGGLLKVVAAYYGPRSLWLFDKIAGLLAMGAVVVTVSGLQRSNELTALMAAGISPARTIMPLLVAAGIVAGFGAANREFGLPQVRDKLSRNAQDWLGDKSRNCTPKYDPRNDILISGQGTLAKNRRITDPQFRLPPELATWGRLIVAGAAYRKDATADHPAGYLLKGVTQPPNLAKLPSLSMNGEKTLFSPADTPWLAPGECFVASVVTFEQLTVGNGWRQYLSSYELIAGLKSQAIEPGADVWVTLHARLLQPLLDLSLVLLALPLVLGRKQRNIFLAAGLCVGIMLVVFLVVLTCHGLGSNYLLDPAIATWLPLALFGPLAYTLARPIWD